MRGTGRRCTGSGGARKEPGSAAPLSANAAFTSSAALAIVCVVGGPLRFTSALEAAKSAGTAGVAGGAEEAAFGAMTQCLVRQAQARALARAPSTQLR